MKQAKFLKVNGIKLNKRFAGDQKKLRQKRQQLLDRAKKKQAQQAEQENTIEVTSKVAKEEVKKLKQKLRSKQQAFLKVKNQNRALTKEHRENQQKLRKLQAQQQSFSQKVRQQREIEQAALKEKQDELDRQAATLAKQQAWLKENGLDSDGDVHQVITALSQQNEYLAQLVQTAMTKNQDLFQSRKAAYKLAREAQKEVRQLKANKEKQDRKIVRWKKQSEIDRQRRCEAIEQAQHTQQLANASIESMISELNQRLSLETIDSYRQLNSLAQKYDRIFNDFLTANSHVDEYCYGYVEKYQETDGKDYFLLHDINHDQTNSVVVPERFMANLGSNMVVRCQHNNLDQWEVDQVYQTISTKTTSVPNRRHHRRIKRTDDNLPDVYLTDKDELLWLKGQKLVLVGNKYSVGFLNELKKYCQVQSYDAYEGREHRIFQAMKAADIVFILIGSVPHFVTEYTKATSDLGKNSNKVQTFEVPAKYDGVIRLHYLYVNRKRLLENGTD